MCGINWRQEFYMRDVTKFQRTQELKEVDKNAFYVLNLKQQWSWNLTSCCELALNSKWSKEDYEGLEVFSSLEIV